MFSLKEGPLSNYRKELIRELCIVDDSKYIFNASVSHAYEDSNYNNLNETDLQNALNKDLESFNINLQIIKIINICDMYSGGWPFVTVQNTKPMSLNEFLSTINKMYVDEDINYIIDECLDCISIVKEV